MIVKIKSFKKPDFRRLLEYMLNDENRLFNNKDKSFLITHNIKGKKIDRLVTQFLENEKFRKRRRKDSVILTHEIISFHKDDSENINVEKLEEIVREYIKQRNIKGLYVAVPHFDKEHYHIHICASGVEYRYGNSLRMTKAGFQKLKKDIQNFQIERFPEISKSLVSHDRKGKKQQTEKEYQQKLRTGRATKKENVRDAIKSCLKTSKSKIEFYTKLQESGLEIYKRSGKITGVTLGKMKFRFAHLGFTNEMLEEMNQGETRRKDLIEIRTKHRKTITRNR